MLRLKNVSKFYYSKGVVASGFSKVDLELEIGEFVAITGESGSGKSTLLNVISGLDTYEEGELYINGEETSHYTEKDFEEYRKNYIGNIFQNFNLINSYTVYQNIELVLLLNGYNKKEITSRVNSLIEEVDLTAYKKTKVSKLSGGQKQRVAIARALAKETKIIIADEPTGNLDSKSADGIIELLSKIAKDKLVIIVTHNFEQVEKHVTRKIKMYDGKIIEDKEIKKHKSEKAIKLIENDSIKTLSKVKLGIRNTFNIIPKFVLLFLVYMFITISLTSIYSSNTKKETDELKSGVNTFFSDSRNERIVLKKKDKTEITEAELEKIKAIDNIDYLFRDDYLHELSIAINSNNEYYGGRAKNIESFKGVLTHGRMPQNDYEIIVSIPKDSYLNVSKEILETTEFSVGVNTRLGYIESDKKIKIVGIEYYDTKNSSVFGYVAEEFYFSSNYTKILREVFYKGLSSEGVEIAGINFESKVYEPLYRITPNKNVPRGEVYISSDLNYLCPKSKCLNNALKIKVKNNFFSTDLSLKISKTYTRNDYTKLTGEKDYVEKNGEVYVNAAQYAEIYARGEYQLSVFVKDFSKIEETSKQLNELGFDTFELYKSKIKMGEILLFVNIFTGFFTIIMVVALIFISYFVIKLILKSRNTYFTTIRILGASKSVATQILHIELWTLVNLTYLVFLGLVYMVKEKIISSNYIYNLTELLTKTDYILIYILLLLFSMIISTRFAKKIFKKSAMNTYREEV